MSKTELINIILSFSEKYSSIRRELILQLTSDKQSILKQYFKEIDKIFRIFDNRNFSTYEISRRLKEIIKQVESADADIKID